MNFPLTTLVTTITGMTCFLLFFCCRYHRCQGDPDGHVFTHRLLTEGFREDEVYQPANVVIFSPTAEQFSEPALGSPLVAKTKIFGNIRRIIHCLNLILIGNGICL